MSTNFPSALDTFTNPNGSDSLNAAAVPHAEQHANANDAIEALQAKVGINGSAVATSLDYRISTAETGLGGKISSSEKGSANGVATLGFDGKVPSSQLPPLDYIPTSERGAAGGVAGLVVFQLVALMLCGLVRLPFFGVCFDARILFC